MERTYQLKHIDIPPLKNRVITLAQNAIQKTPEFLKKYGWDNDCLMFFIASDLMTRTNLMSLPTNSHRKLRMAFSELMNFNEILDPFTNRFRQGEESALYLENFWNLDKHLTNFQWKSISKWVQLNRKINIISDKFNNGYEINWNELRNDGMTGKLKYVFDKFKNKSEVEKSVLFRALSSIGFAYALIGIKENDMSKEKLVESTVRIGSMTMAMQTIDDYWKIRRDYERGIAGIGQSLIKSVGGNPLEINDDSLQYCILGIKSVALGCLDVVNIDSQTSVKHTIAKSALSLLSVFRTVTNIKVASQIKTEDGSWFTKSLKNGSKILSSSSVDDNLRQSTIEALNLSSVILLQ